MSEIELANQILDSKLAKHKVRTTVGGIIILVAITAFLTYVIMTGINTVTKKLDGIVETQKNFDKFFWHVSDQRTFANQLDRGNRQTVPGLIVPDTEVIVKNRQSEPPDKMP